MIIAINKDDPWWEKTRAFAKDCSWQPGRRLAERMSKNDFRDWEKVFVAVHGEDVVGFCVLEENGKSEHHGLYEKYGFKKIADFEPTVGLANQLFEIKISI